MGRAKLAMEFISKEKRRNTAFIKRKKGLFKKGREFSILCNVPVCIIIYPYNDGKQPLEAEVYAFKGDTATTTTSPMDLGRASDHKIIAMEIIERYLRVPKEERNKRALNLYDMFDEWTRKADQELCKLRQKNVLANNKYPSRGCNNDIIDGFDVDQLMELLVHLDQKIECVKQRISVIKGEANDHEAAVASLVPCSEPTPFSSLMTTPFENNNAHHHYHQMGHSELFQGFTNQIPLFNYPVINNNYCNHYQDCCNQVMPYNNHQQIAFPNEVGAIRMDDHDNNRNNNNNNNLVMYNMNDMMGGVGHMYYDQRSVIAENADATSSYGGGLPMSMPLQLPMVRPNVPLLPRQRQYQMFY